MGSTDSLTFGSPCRTVEVRKTQGFRAQTRNPVTLESTVFRSSFLSESTPPLFCKDYLTFEAFIACKRVPKLWPVACVILDNCPIHKRDEIEPWITQAGAQLIYLPPYSPDFSPIANCWSKIKSILRSIGARSYSDLEKAIEEVFNQVSSKDIQNWCTYCCYCTALD